MHNEIHLGRFRYDYPEGVAYEVTCADNTSLHWRCVGGEDQGREASETIDRVPLSEHQHLLSWTESDGLVVAQVVDYTAGRVDAVLVLPGGKRLVLQGTVRRLESAP